MSICSTMQLDHLIFFPEKSERKSPCKTHPLQGVLYPQLSSSADQSCEDLQAIQCARARTLAVF
jgi:hypothetical protein